MPQKNGNGATEAGLSIISALSMTAVHTNNIEEKAAETIPQRPVAGIGQTVQPEIMKVVGWPRIREVA